MLTTKPDLWNDGPALPDFMGSEGAPPIARRHLCSGGGGGGESQGPDYSQYIKTMTDIGQTGLDRSSDLYDWAVKSGLDLSEIAKTISTKAGAAADTQQGASDRLMGDWERIYKPIYEAQAADALRMQGDLPAYEEHQAGKYGADASMAIDQGINTQKRNMRAQGFSPSAVASGAIGTAAATARALGVTQASEQGRGAARTEARTVAANALQQGTAIPGVAGQQAGLANTNRGQQFAAPAAAINTSVSAQTPGMGYYNAALPYMKAWGDTTLASERNQLERERQQAENSDGGFMSTILPLAGGIAGSFFGPMGSAIGSKLGSAAGSAIGGSSGSGTLFNKGGRARGRRYAAGGAIDTSAPMGGGNLVPPEASPSGGDVVDDVPAMVSEGEFVIPKRTVDWKGDQFFQKLIAKVDQEIEQQTIAAPEEGGQPLPEEAPGLPEDTSQGAFNMRPPTFMSEGAMA